MVVGDEAATPHPLTGSGFNTGASSTDHVGKLVRQLGTGDKGGAFSAYGKAMKDTTDVMVAKALKFFEKNIGALQMANPPEAPSPGPGVVGPSSAPPSSGPSSTGTLVTDGTGVKPEEVGTYADIVHRVEALVGGRGYTPEDIGVITPEDQQRYDEIARRVAKSFGFRG